MCSRFDMRTHPAMVWPDWCEKALAEPYQEELW